MRAKRVVLPADVYDTLELSALAYGGIGAGSFGEGTGGGPLVRVLDEHCPPMCAAGHAYASGIEGFKEGNTPWVLGPSTVQINPTWLWRASTRVVASRATPAFHSRTGAVS